MKKSTLIMILSLVLAIAVGLGGTLAYLTDTDADVNVMVLGDVQILQNEQQRIEQGNAAAGLEEFEQYQTLLPYVTIGATTKEDVVVGDYTIKMRDESVKNYVDKIVTVTNTGNNDAFVRTIIAIPNGGVPSDTLAKDAWLHWNVVTDTDPVDKNFGWYHGANSSTLADLNATGNENGVPTGVIEWSDVPAQTDYVGGVAIGEEGIVYDLYIFTNKNIVKPGETTAPNLVGIYLDKSVDKDENGYFYIVEGERVDIDIDPTKVEVLVATQAVQAGGFEEAGAWYALDAAFGDISATNHPWSNGMPDVDSPGKQWPNNNPPEGNSFFVMNEAELLAALNAEGESKYIIFGDNITVIDTKKVTGNVVIDLNGYDLDASANTGRPFEMADGSSLTIDATEEEITCGAFGLVNIPAGNNAEVTLNGGNYVGELANGSLVRARGTGEIVINLNDINYQDTSDSQDGYIISCDADFDQNLVVNVSGGEYVAPRGFNVGVGTLNMSGADLTITDTVEGYAVVTYKDAYIDDSNINTQFRSLAVGYQGVIEVKNSTVNSDKDHALYAFTTGGTLDVSNSTVTGNGSNGAYYFNQPKAGYYSEVIIDGTSVYKKDNR